MKHVLPAFALFGVLSGAAAAQDVDRVSTSTVYACAEIEIPEARLACYDSAVGRLKAAEETGEVVSVTREQVEEVRRESFGFNLPTLPKLGIPGFGNSPDGAIDEVQLGVARVGSAPGGGFLVTLDNGQVWEQIDSKSVFYSAKKGVELATIKTAALGSFMMKLDNGKFFRVRRVQ